MNHSKKPFHLDLEWVFGAYASTNNHNHISLEILYPFIKMFLLFFIFHGCHFFPPRIIDVKHSAEWLAVLNGFELIFEGPKNV